MAALLGGTIAASARTLSPAEALARLDAPGAAQKAPARVKTAPRLVYTANTSLGDAAVYVFDSPRAGDGFMILSADDCAAPMLGYADNGSLDPANMPPQLKWWLEEYARQIEFMSKKGFSSAARAPRTDRPAIAPQIKTDWDQGAPYNQSCPTYGPEATYTGCVATSMAQVMNYWQYPERGQGKVSYECTGVQKRLSIDFSLRAFDWANMLPTYIDNNWTEAQAAAVAYLMKACGYAVKMDYGVDSSGALAMNISNALVKYFNYDGNIDYQLRATHSYTEWETLIYENLRDVGPILYGGASYIGGGHSFICDGYDGNGFFHFNWGWTGMSNGYFSLDALDPYALGAGGGMGGGYNFTQDAVLGIQPPTGKPVVEKPMTLIQNGTLVGSIANDSIKFNLTGEAEAMWVNYNPSTLKLLMGAIVERVDQIGTPAKGVQISDKRLQIAPGYGTSAALIDAGIALPELQLADGTYRLTVATQLLETGEEEPWVPVGVSYGYSNSVLLTKEGTTYTVENAPMAQLTIKSYKIIGGLYYGMANRFRITVANNSDLELSRGFAPAVATDGGVKMLGESVLVTVPPHSEVTREWDTMLYLLDQYFNISENTLVDLVFFDETTYLFLRPGTSLPTVLHPNPGVPHIITTKAPVVTNGTPYQEEIDGSTRTVYYIDSKDDIQVGSAMRLVSGRFAYPMYACIASSTEVGNEGIALENYTGHTVFIDEPGTYDFSTSISFAECRPDQLYYVMMAYSYGSSLAQIGPHMTYFRLKSSGVDDIAIDNGGIDFDGRVITARGAIEIYSVAGVPVASGIDAISTDGIAPGIYIARAGKSTLKIAIK